MQDYNLKLTWFGELADPTEESDFQCAKWPESRKRMRFLCLLTAIIYLSALFSDYILMGQGFRLNLMIAARLLAFSLGILTCLMTRLDCCNANRLSWALTVYMLFILLSESLEMGLRQSMIRHEDMHITAIIILTYYFFIPPRVLTAFVAGIGGSIVYLSTMLLTHAPPNEILDTLLVFCLINGFGLYFLTRFGQAQRREYKALLRLKEQAEMDSLTEVFNRRRALEQGERLFKQSKRFGQPLSVLMLDIDHFKVVNDTYGHDVGDRVLKDMARRWVLELREVDVFGRLGGDEFVVFLPQSNLDEALGVGERLRGAVAREAPDSALCAISVAVSIGVATLTDEVEDVDALLRGADMALYRAKNSGRNRVCA